MNICFQNKLSEFPNKKKIESTATLQGKLYFRLLYAAAISTVNGKVLNHVN